MPRSENSPGETVETTRGAKFSGPSRATRVQLVVAWCQDDASRVGEVLGDPAAPSGRTVVFGRGDPGPGRAGSVRQVPGRNEAARPWASPRLSRDQLALTARGAAVDVVNLGRRELIHRGRVVDTAALVPGDVVEVRNQLVLLAVTRPPTLPPAPALHPFGEADEHGIVGESPAAWELRRRVRFAGRRSGHVLVLGPSGAGKELVAAAIHAVRGRGPFVARNAATLPEGLVDAELFGNVRNYPNPGMPERPGLVGAADGGTLFLDEIAELPHAAQAHLLRVLDAGEYQRLGDARVLRSRFRLVGATNRPVSVLKEDVAARFPLSVSLPGLDQRREDIPLLARHLLARIAAGDDELAGRFFVGGEPRVAASLVVALLTQTYPTNVRQLLATLWRSLAESPGAELVAPAGETVEPDDPPQTAAPDPWAAWVGAPAGSIPPEALQAALDAENGQVEAAARRLGLPSRYSLSRLIRRHGLVSRRQGGR